MTPQTIKNILASSGEDVCAKCLEERDNFFLSIKISKTDSFQFL
jgi:hypothetical protein